MFGLGIASVLAKVGGSLGKKIYNKAKEKAMDKGMEIVAEHLVEAPQSEIAARGQSHGLKLSQAMKRVRLGVAEDWVKERILEYAENLAVGIDSDDEASGA